MTTTGSGTSGVPAGRILGPERAAANGVSLDPLVRHRVARLAAIEQTGRWNVERSRNCAR